MPRSCTQSTREMAEKKLTTLLADPYRPTSSITCCELIEGYKINEHCAENTKIGIPVGIASAIPLAMYSNPLELNRRKSCPWAGVSSCMRFSRPSFRGGPYLNSSSRCSTSIYQEYRYTEDEFEWLNKQAKPLSIQTNGIFRNNRRGIHHYSFFSSVKS